MRRFISRISIRLLAFNVLLVFLPVAGVTYLEVYERKLLQAQEQSMVQQGRLLAAALSERGPIDAELVEPILIRLDQRTTSRIRVIDPARALISDTSRLGPKRATDEPGPGDASAASLRASWLYRVGSAAFRLFDRVVSGPRPTVGSDFYSADETFEGGEIEQALSGQYGAATRITSGGQRSVTLYSALPIESGGEWVGAVLVSQSTFQILQDLYEVRLATFQFLLGAVGVAAILSLFVSTTISRPIKNLRSQAQLLLDRRGRLTGRFEGSLKQDEIGDLSRALRELSDRLEERMHFIESFAADVSHEFKNPLASMRAAAEMLAEVDEPEARERFAHIVQVDIARLERLLSDVREVTLLDASEDGTSPHRVELHDLIDGVLAQERYRKHSIAFEPDASMPPPVTTVSPDRMTRVVENLLDNALDFSGDGSVRVVTRLSSTEITMTVEDDGPGIPPESQTQVFARFYSYRPSGEASGHSGLGLAIVKSIVERRGGSIKVVPSSLGGAAFEIVLRPASPVSEPEERQSLAAARTRHSQ